MANEEWGPFADAARQFTEGQNQFARMWSDFAGKMGSAGMAFSPDSTPPDAARQMRAAFLKAWSEQCEQFMRSSEFLDSWKKVMDGAIQLRRQMNESLGRMQHEMGGTSRQDVDHLMMAMSHLERRLVDNLERGTERMDELALRIEALERQLAGNGGPAPRPGSAPARKAAANQATGKAAKKVAKKATKKAAKRKRPAAKKLAARRRRNGSDRPERSKR
jgi:hypothetical protein